MIIENQPVNIEVEEWIFEFKWYFGIGESEETVECLDQSIEWRHQEIQRVLVIFQVEIELFEWFN